MLFSDDQFSTCQLRKGQQQAEIILLDLTESIPTSV